LLAGLIAETAAALDFEHAIDRVVDGDTAGGLAELRRLRQLVQGPVWALSFALWRLSPATARPMLAWRRRAHSRGGAGEGVGSLWGEGVAL
jgi:hypothetical protein